MIVKQIVEAILPLGDKLGGYVYAILAPLAVLLFLFGRYSYKIFKVVTILASVALGAFAGYAFLAPAVGENIPVIAGVIKPEHTIALVCAVFMALICSKIFKIAVLITGAGLGYLFLSGLLHSVLRDTEFVGQVILNTDMTTAVLFSTILTVLVVLLAMFIFQKFFKPIYIIATSIVSGAAALAIPAIFIFASLPFIETAVIVAAGLGAFVGLIFCGKQMSYYRYFD